MTRKMVGFFSLSLLALVILVACSPVPPAAVDQGKEGFQEEVGESGIEGQTLSGPTCPVVSSDEDCEDLPVKAMVLIFDADDNPVTQVKTDGEGYFKVTLPPGSYLLRAVVPDAFPDDAGAESAGIQGEVFPRAEDQAVKVLPGQFTQVTLTFDSGIR